MHAELYTDGVEEITVSGSIVRVDLVSLSPTERDENNAPKRVLCQRLILSVDSFANSVDVMQKALQGLVDAGVIRRNPGAESLRAGARVGNAGEPRSASRSEPTRSPNASPISADAPEIERARPFRRAGAGRRGPHRARVSLPRRGLSWR